MMDLLKQIVDLAVKFDYIVFAAVFGLLVLNFALNAISNVYKKTNRKLLKSKKVLQTCKVQSRLTYIGEKIPQVYRNQWHCFVFSQNVTPSEVLSFEKRRQKVFGIWLFVALSVVNALYGVGLAFEVVTMQIVPYLAAYGASLVLFVVLLCIFAKLKEKRSRKIFNSFLAVLDFCLPDGVRTDEVIAQKTATEEAVESAVTELNFLKNTEAPKDSETLTKVSEILRQKGLNGGRTGEQQRKLNVALNSLLQTMCKREREKSAI